VLRRIFYGWKIVGASAVILALGLGMFTSTNSVYVKPVCDTLGFARSEFTFYRTILTLSSALVLPFFGRIVKWAGVRSMLLFGAIALSLVTFGYSFATSLWHFYILAFINGIVYNNVSFMVIGILISTWFEDKRGLATGLAYAGSGLGGEQAFRYLHCNPIRLQFANATVWGCLQRKKLVVGPVHMAGP